MCFEIYLKEQLKLHKSVQLQDIIKMCYQASFGAEHLLSDLDKAWEHLKKEYDEASPSDEALYEKISQKVCRVNLGGWKKRGLPVEWLFRMFVLSCKAEEQGKEQFMIYLKTAEGVILSEKTAFTENDWKNYLNAYLKSGITAVHHSKIYRENEHPSYRIVNCSLLRALPVLIKAAEHINEDRPCVIAIDGRAASGKTTLASALSEILDADVIRMDDFFVPPELRSEERFRKAGENIHHERFISEVLPFITEKKPFSYRIFDCSLMDYNGERKIGDKSFRIVEGSYSCHPKFSSYADITVFSNVSEGEQIERIRKRNGEEMLKMFQSRWIPMEEEYFSCYDIKNKADIRSDSF